MSTHWSGQFAARAHRNKGSAIRELLSVADRPEVISFAGGLPAPEAFPTQAVAAATDVILSEQGRVALQYGPTEGYRPLREHIAAQYRQRGVPCTAENVLPLTGAQQGLDFIGRIWIDEGDPVLIDAPTYTGALQAWSTHKPRYVALPVDRDGMQIERVSEIFKLIYALPNFQNPSGVSLSLERRHAMLEAAHRTGALIVEDDPYRALRYSGQDAPALVELEGQMLGAEWDSRGRVISLGTFSKTLAPGLRVGWALAPRAAIRAMVVVKQYADLHTSSLNQMIVSALIENGTVERNVPMLRALYRERRDTMLAALARDFGGRATWTEPEGGLFLWLELPEGIHTGQLLPKALEHNVAFVPGSAFFVDGSGSNALRLNFSCMPPARIDEGIRRLAAVLDGRGS